MSHYIPVNTRGAPPKQGRVLAGGIAIVSAGLGLFYLNLHRRHMNKERNDPVYPGAWPTWQFRLRQAAYIPDAPLHAGTMTLKASRIEPRAAPLAAPAQEHNGGHSVIPKERTPAPAFDENGERLQLNPRRAHQIAEPAPQRDRGDGRPYTKASDMHDVGMRRGKDHQRGVVH
ncbi:hypothetical protein GLOTRDRAFT_140585 [Gloeophyllum trabeum ATCC 11539]|uniref:Uncharacterized protein n=1 Tax=Gloeophyllum trabeum (strain ATCC 11539 / FP-39264 / Madison 617) TaxID=670483 RepID=S7PXD2_GLOTA|nr:uncharacterized protein GLOTRDRAFT_140585 [Gloeophyllum trabeum ATCC 11539]EPQ52168.1 hypothetical protein GLOTRDRAFT_140585 [Gloeophyllum trabeum ATCC 11539]